MCPARKQFTLRSEVLNFTYPKLHTGKKWYVDFCAHDPATGTMRRKKYHLDSYKKVTDRRKRASELIESLTRRLRDGWSPWVSQGDGRIYTLISHGFEKYRMAIEKLPKYTTRKSYTSFLNTLECYISNQVVKPMYAYQLNTPFFSDFLDWLYFEKEVSARTRNNYRAWCASLMSFFMEREYVMSNPVEKIKPIPENPKKRQPLTPSMLRQLQSYLRKNDLMMLLACRMEYYTFIRPQELTCIRIDDISVKEQSVFIASGDSKNKRDGKVGLNDEIIKLMLELGLFSKPGDYYLFGDKMRCCNRKGSSEQFRRRWIRIRKALRWSDEYQFYSLKDSGIRDLANAAGIVIARDQARHSDITTTNRYLQGRDLPVHDETKTFHGEL
ncbi:MAG: site-specific integrase [Bacteroides sp.]|nr:site-specific integrase [Bacteroides sp.]MCM1390766.1 site-specific integrase [Bacteroides sp.]